MKLKDKMMNSMMDKQFKNMSSEEKKDMMDSMMDKFFGNMTEEEKRDMMSNMMPKMMSNMMGNGEGGMMNMISRMMASSHKSHSMHAGGNKNNPMEMCMKMMSNMSGENQTEDFATPELRILFGEWCQQIEIEILEHTKASNKIDITELSQKFSLTEDSIKYLLTRMAKDGRIDYKHEK